MPITYTLHLIPYILQPNCPALLLLGCSCKQGWMRALFSERLAGGQEIGQNRRDKHREIIAQICVQKTVGKVRGTMHAPKTLCATLLSWTVAVVGAFM